MKKIICFIITAFLVFSQLTVFAEGAVDLGEILSGVTMELKPVCDSENIEVGDQFLVSFTLTNPEPYLSFQIQGSFDASKAQVIAPVYTNNFVVLQNDFDNTDGTFSLVAADLTVKGSSDDILCSILFEATAAGEFDLKIDGEGLETLIGRKETAENGDIFYIAKLGNAVFSITEDTDGDKVYIIKEPDPITPYNDMFGYDWAERAVSVLYQLGALENIADESFLPGGNVTRGDFVTMLVKVCSLKSGSNAETFKDVDESSYCYEPIMIARSLNLVFGDEGGNFRPDESITRQDICAILFRTMRYMNKVREMDDAQKYVGSFSDNTDISEYALDSVAAMIRAKIIQGDDTGLIRPKDNMTRAEAAVVLNRVAEFNRLISL